MTELPVRVAVPSGRHRDLLLDVPTGARVGDAAVALAAALGSRVKALYRDAAELPADLVLAEAGVVPGTTLGWGAPAPAVMAIGAVAEVSLVDGTSRPVLLRGTCVVGRGGADIDFADPTVSRRHALMGAVPGGVMATDLGGRNGTWVDGRRITNASALASFGATVRVGESEMTIRPRPPIPPAAVWGADGSVALYVSDPCATPAATIRLGPGAGRVSIAGPRPAQLALVRHLLVQLAQASLPWHLAVVAGAGGDAWRWALWLPQLAAPFAAGRRAVAARPRARAARLAELQGEIGARAAGERRGQPPVVVVLDGQAPSPAMADIAARGPAMGVYVIHLPGEGDAPITDATAVSLDATGGLMARPGRRAFAFAPASCAVEVADEAARNIAAASMSGAIAPTAGPRLSIPDPLKLAEIWSDHPSPVLVGTRNDEPLALNLALPGRHTLIRGGRGSGRTSTLRTVAAAASLAHGPDRLRIVAVDPTGELTELRGLPHTDWTVSRLDTSVLQAIEAASGPLVLVLIDGLDSLHVADSRLIARLRKVAAQPSVRLVVGTDGTLLPLRLESLFTSTLTLPANTRCRTATWAEGGESEAVVIAHLPPRPTGDPVPKVIALDIDALAEPRRGAGDAVRYLDELVDAATAAAAAASPAAPRRGVEPALRVLLVEDHAVLAEMIEAGLERGGCSVTATCSTVEDALDAVGLAAIDIAIVDVDMGTSRRSMLGVDVIEALRAAVPALPVVALSRHARPDTATVDRVMRLAPEAFVSEATAADGLVGVVRQVAGGGRYVSPALRSGTLSSAFDQMTAAEQRLVIELARHPDTRARLARRLHLSISTVDSHLRAVKAKVAVELAARGGLAADGVVSTEALIGWALEHGYDRAAVARPARAATSGRR